MSAGAGQTVAEFAALRARAFVDVDDRPWSARSFTCLLAQPGVAALVTGSPPVPTIRRCGVFKPAAASRKSAGFRPTGFRPTAGAPAVRGSMALFLPGD